MKDIVKLAVLCFIFFVVSDVCVGQRNAATRAESQPDAGVPCPGKITKQSRPDTKINLGELTKKVVRLPRPRYPQSAKVSGVYGTVTVEVVVELNSGTVVWTQVINGHPLLRSGVNDAACRARFTGTYDLDGYGSGTLSYTFRRRR